jgi:hypothetical protein
VSFAFGYDLSLGSGITGREAEILNQTAGLIYTNDNSELLIQEAALYGSLGELTVDFTNFFGVSFLLLTEERPGGGRVGFDYHTGSSNLRVSIYEGATLLAAYSTLLSEEETAVIGTRLTVQAASAAGAVPVPAALPLLLGGIAALGLCRRRRARDTAATVA